MKNAARAAVLALVAIMLGGCPAPYKPHVVGTHRIARSWLFQAHTTLNRYVLERIANAAVMENCTRILPDEPRAYPSVYLPWKPLKLMTLSCRVHNPKIYARFEMAVGTSSVTRGVVMAYCMGGKGMEWACSDRLEHLLDRAEEQAKLLSGIPVPAAAPAQQARSSRASATDEVASKAGGELERAAVIEEQAIRKCASVESDRVRQRCEDLYQSASASPSYYKRRGAIREERAHLLEPTDPAYGNQTLPVLAAAQFSIVDEQRSYCADVRPREDPDQCAGRAWDWDSTARQECNWEFGRSAENARSRYGTVSSCILQKVTEKKRMQDRQQAAAARAAAMKAVYESQSRRRRNAAIAAGVRGVNRMATRELAQTQAEIARSNAEVQRIRAQQRQQDELERRQREDRQRRADENRRMAEAERRRQIAERQRQRRQRANRARALSGSNESSGGGAAGGRDSDGGRSAAGNDNRSSDRDGAPSSSPGRSAAFERFCNVAASELGAARPGPIEWLRVQELANMLTRLAEMRDGDRISLPPEARKLFERTRSLAAELEPRVKRVIDDERWRVNALPRPDSDLQREFKRAHQENVNATGLGEAYRLADGYRNDWGNPGTDKDSILRDVRALRQLAAALRQIQGRSFGGRYIQECR